MDVLSWSLHHCRRCGRQGRTATGGRIANLALFGLIFVAVSNPGHNAYAYLDPGTGGIILQMLLGGVAGVLMVAKLYWHQFTALFRRNRPDNKASPETTPE